MNLINQTILHQRFINFDFPSGDEVETIAKHIAGWQTALKDRDLTKTKERSIQGFFLQKFFGGLLGYAPQTVEGGEWTLIQHPTSEVDAQEPDGAMGFFSKDEQITRAVIELKDAKRHLIKSNPDARKAIRRSNKPIYTPPNLIDVIGLCVQLPRNTPL